MKHLILIISLIAMAIFPTAFHAEGKTKNKTARIEFATHTHDFGQIPADQPAKVEFRFTNTGAANLVITQATSECGCTKPVYPEYPIAPGKDGVISVTYSPKGHSGHFEKNVTIRTNGEPGKVKLKIKGEVAR